MFLKDGTFTELWTTSFIESMGVACSDSISYNRVQVLSIPVLLFYCVSFRSLVNLCLLRYMSCWKILSEFLGLMNLMFLLDKNYYYYVWVLTCAHIQIFFSLDLLTDEWCWIEIVLNNNTCEHWLTIQRKTRRHLHKNATSYSEPIREVTSTKRWLYGQLHL